MNILDIVDKLEFKPVVKRQIKYNFLNVNNDFKKLKKYSFTICTNPTIWITKIKGKVETQRRVEIGDFVIRGPSRDIYSTSADRFFSSYNIDGIATVIPIKKYTATLDKKFFKDNNLTVPYIYKGPLGDNINLYPGDYLIRDYSPKNKKTQNEYWRIDSNVLKKTYEYV